MDVVFVVGGGDIVVEVGIYDFNQFKLKNGVCLFGRIGKIIFWNIGVISISLFLYNFDGLDGLLDDFFIDGIIFDGNGKDVVFVVYGCQWFCFIDVIFCNLGIYGCVLQVCFGFMIMIV